MFFLAEMVAVVINFKIHRVLSVDQNAFEVDATVRKAWQDDSFDVRKHEPCRRSVYLENNLYNKMWQPPLVFVNQLPNSQAMPVGSSYDHGRLFTNGTVSRSHRYLVTITANVDAI